MGAKETKGTFILAAPPIVLVYSPAFFTKRSKPDPEIFEETVFDYDTLLNRMREQSFLNAGIRIVLIDDRGEEPVVNELCFEGGIKSFVSYLTETRNNDPVHPDVIYMKAEKDTSIAEIALQYNDGYYENVMTFANNMNTIEGGTHETGFKAGLTRVLNDYARKAKILKDSDKNLSGEEKIAQ